MDLYGYGDLVSKSEDAGMKRTIDLHGQTGRTWQQLRHHYEVEQVLATRLKNAPREARPHIYATMYHELFAQVPDHPRLTRREDPLAIQKRDGRAFKLIRHVIHPGTVFLEFGPGDCRFAFKVCKHVKKVYAVDISPQTGEFASIPANFEFIIYDGYHLSIPDHSVDIVFSDQLIEHLHPEDVYLHFQIIRKILKQGGRYIFATPHRFSGPHDISRFFSDEANGFHLKEWTYGELVQLLKECGYSQCRFYRFAMNYPFRMPKFLILSLEKIARPLRKEVRSKMTRIFFPSIAIEAIV
jgi:SAM-dependent methyltransferase